MGFEPTTSTLARLRSTTELHPLCLTYTQTKSCGVKAGSLYTFLLYLQDFFSKISFFYKNSIRIDEAGCSSYHYSHGTKTGSGIFSSGVQLRSIGLHCFCRTTGTERRSRAALFFSFRRRSGTHARHMRSFFRTLHGGRVLSRKSNGRTIRQRKNFFSHTRAG